MKYGARSSSVPANMAVTFETPPGGSRCSCGKPAVVRFQNSIRFSDACSNDACKQREMAWASNSPYGISVSTKASRFRPPQESPMLSEALFNRGLRRRFPGER